MGKKEGKEGTRYIWVKDNDLTVPGFKTYEEADAKRKQLLGTLSLKKDREGQPVDARVRVLLRQRTGTFDVVVKLKTAATRPEPRQEATDAPAE